MSVNVVELGVFSHTFTTSNGSVFNGLVFPSSTLTSTWFTVLASIVALNTLIYVGLTLAKFIPMPHQFPAKKVRTWLAIFHIFPDPHPEKTWKPLTYDVSSDPYENIIQSALRRDIPRVLALVGGVTFIIAVFSSTFLHTSYTLESLPDFVAGMSLLILAQIFTRTQVSSRTLTWTWSITASLLIGIQFVEITITNNITSVGTALILTTMAIPLTLSWKASAVLAGSTLTIATLCGFITTATHSIPLAALLIIAFFAGAVILNTRFTAIRALAEQNTRTSLIATTDPLTATLTPTGFTNLAPTYQAVAIRFASPLCLTRVHINNFTDLTTAYGTQYGDTVITALASALNTTIREGDLICRERTATFLTLGMGTQPDPTHFATRIHTALSQHNPTLGKIPLQLHIGTATGAASTPLTELIADTAAQMHPHSTPPSHAEQQK